MSPVPTACACARTFTAAELDAELGRVHEREFARLLLRAAALCARGRERATQAELRCWKRAALRARRLAVADGYELPGVLRQCLTRAPGGWAPVGELARAACQCSVSEFRRWRTRRAAAPQGFAEVLEHTGAAEVVPW